MNSLVVTPRGVNAEARDSLRCAVRIGTGHEGKRSVWSSWFPLLPERFQPCPQDDPSEGLFPAVCHVDVVKSEEAFSWAQVAVKWDGDSDTPPCFDVTWAAWSGSFSTPRTFLRKPRARLVAVPFRSQRMETSVPSRSVCLPTSLAMVLTRGGVEERTAAVARLSFDPTYEVWGNWVRACLVAGAHGFRARVQAMDRLGDLLPWLDRGVAPIVSLAYEAGELDGAPIASTSGHLVVVRGVSSGGGILVCDPAGRDAADGVIEYDQDQFARAWKGVAIIVEALRRPR